MKRIFVASATDFIHLFLNATFGRKGRDIIVCGQQSAVGGRLPFTFRRQRIQGIKNQTRN
jgi:hypothetical protein